MIRVIPLILTQKCGSINVYMLLFLRLIDRIKTAIEGVHVSQRQIIDYGVGLIAPPLPPQIVNLLITY